MPWCRPHRLGIWPGAPLQMPHTYFLAVFIISCVAACMNTVPYIAAGVVNISRSVFIRELLV